MGRVEHRREVAVVSRPPLRAKPTGNGRLAYCECISRVTSVGSAVPYTTDDYCIVLINARDRN